MVCVSLQEGFLSKVDSLKGVQHVVILSQVLVYLLVIVVYILHDSDTDHFCWTW